VARAVYSSQFAAYQGSDVPAPFAVPTDNVAVIREVDAYAEAALGYFQVLISDDEIAPQVCIASLELSGLVTSSHWEGRVVVPGGGYIWFVIGTLGTSYSAYCGGYLLANASGS